MVKLKINNNNFTAFYDGNGSTQLKETIDIIMEITKHLSNLLNVSFEETLHQLFQLTMERKENDSSFEFEVNKGYERGNDISTNQY